MWIPEKAQRQAERERTSTIRTYRFKLTQLTVEMPGGLVYSVDRMVLPAELSTKLKRSEIEELFHDMLAQELGGKVTGESDCKMGSIPGRELVIESGLKTGRVRLFVAGGGRVFILQVAGSAGDVEKSGTQTFLNTCRLPTAPPKAPSPGPAPPPGPGGTPGTSPPIPVGAATTIAGGAFDPVFKDAGPEGTLLVGLEIGLGKFFDNDVVRSVRPVYRKNGVDTFGDQHGTELILRVVKAVAKAAMRSGAITVKVGLGVDGLSITFMKVVDGKLDPKDAYESEWIGGRVAEDRTSSAATDSHRRHRRQSQRQRFHGNWAAVQEMRTATEFGC